MNDLDVLCKSLKLIIGIKRGASRVFQSLLEWRSHRDTKFLSQLKLDLDTVANSIKYKFFLYIHFLPDKFCFLRELEELIGRPIRPTQLPLIHSYFEPELHEDLVASQKWTQKRLLYSDGVFHMMTQDNLFRCSRNLKLSFNQPLLRKTGLAATTKEVDDLVIKINNQFPLLRFRVWRRDASQLECTVEASVAGILIVVLSLNGMMITRVVARGITEKSEGPDLWVESQFQVFRRITEHINAALLQYANCEAPDTVFKSVITYAHSFISIFDKKCLGCDRFLVNNSPPTWRDYVMLTPFHVECRPMYTSKWPPGSCF